MIATVIVLIISMLDVAEALAQASLCGDSPPSVDKELKGEINDKAQFLSRLLE